MYSEQKGYLLKQDLWEQETDYILDMQVVNTDAALYAQKPPEKSLTVAEKEKKRKYLESCIQKQ